MKKLVLYLVCFFLSGSSFAQELNLSDLYKDAKEHLINLLAIDTSQPDPQETAAVRYLYKQLNKHGIDWDFLSPHKGKANLLARIKGSNPQAKPLLLISHVDTVAAGQNWTLPPFKATQKDGRIYGLGSTDAKNYTAMHLALFTHIKKLGITPNRDIIFLATSGEESGSNTGIKWLAETQWDKIQAGFALSEGGGIIKAQPQNHPIVFVEGGTKMYMDIKITVFGEAAHASLPVQNNAVYRLSEVLTKLTQFNPPARITPATEDFFRQIAPLQNEDGRTTIDLFLSGTQEQKQMATDIMAKDPFFRTQLKDTLSPVHISSGIDTGASVSEASAIINVRLLPDSDPDQFLEELKNFLGNEEYLTLEILERPQLPFPTPMDGSDELFTVIAQTSSQIWPNSATVLGMSPASGDGEFLRRLGVITYGLGPAMNNSSATASSHVADEFISEEDYQEQIKFFTAIVAQFALDQQILSFPKDSAVHEEEIK